VRPKTIPRRLRLAAVVDYPEGVERRIARPDCEDGPRPCPFVSCRYHLLLDVMPKTGSVKVNFPAVAAKIEKQGDGLPLGELADTCALDVADRGDATLEDVGLRMNVTRERARQIEAKALGKMFDDPVLREFADAFASREGEDALPPVLAEARREYLHRRKGKARAVVPDVPEAVRELELEDSGGEDVGPPGGAAPDWDWGPSEGAPLPEGEEPEAGRDP
jgi:hypothetical protein